MSNNVVGAVQNIFTKHGNGWTAYSLKVNDEVYGLGFNPPPAGVSEGTTVSFSWIPDPRNGKYKKVEGNIKIETSTPAASTGGNSASGGTDWDAKDRRIVYQSSRKDAIEFVGLLLANGALKLGTAQDKKLEIIEDVVNKYTIEFFCAVYQDLESILDLAAASQEDSVPDEYVGHE